MGKRRKYLYAGIILVLLIVLVYVFYTRPEEKGFRYVEDIRFYYALREANLAVVRLEYPFTNPQPFVVSALYALEMLMFNRKTVIFQQIEGNMCYRSVYAPSEGNDLVYHEFNVFSPEVCYTESSQIPTIVVREGEPFVVLGPLLATVSGTQELIVLEMKKLMYKAFPNAPYAESLMREVAARATSQVQR